MARLIEAVRAVGAANPVVLIDGRSGAGKSTLARDLVAQWPMRGRVQLVALDSIYPGWDGLDQGVERAREQILVPHARGLIGVWERWDWAAGEPAEAHAVDPSLPLIIEGSGLLTPVTARLSDVRVWLESPAASRKQRALTRDGDTYRPHWEQWARQEEAHLVRDEPHQHATLLFAMP
ncbi:aminobenzoate synthetase [Microbacterium sp. Root61]|nr:aminobenzoate synthetase [Microbacterium sp. Root61]